jgi:hypothetical protein
VGPVPANWSPCAEESGGLVVETGCPRWRHPVLLLRAIVVSWAVNAAISVVISGLTELRLPLHLVPGWVYMRFQLYAVTGIVLSLPACALGAWLVAKAHEQVRVPATIAVIGLWVPSVVMNPELHRLWANVDQPRFIPYLLLNIVAMLVWLSATLVGGIFVPLRRNAAATGSN